MAFPIGCIIVLRIAAVNMGRVKLLSAAGIALPFCLTELRKVGP